MANHADKSIAGVVGLGMIGGGVAVSLAASGRTPVVYDIRPHAADKLDGVPAPLGSPAEVARAADVVMVAVVNAQQARAVIAGPDGLLSGAHPGLIVVLQSTVALPVVHELAEACAAAGAGFLDCGVTPGDRAAEHGMVAIVGGDDETVEAARPVLDDWAKKVVHCGPVGAGMATKIARNVITYGSWSVVAEAAALAAGAGVDPATLAEVIDSADPQGRTLLQLLHMQQGPAAPATAEQIEVLMTKDLDAARALADSLAVDVPLVQTARRDARQTLKLPPEPAPPAELAAQPGPANAAELAAQPGPAKAGQSGPAAVGRRERGLATAAQVYPGLPMGEPVDGFTEATVDFLFADVWGRAGLSIRDRRLLTLGATAAIGRADLVRIQAAGALDSGDLTAGQLQESVVQIAPYVGWGNATATYQGITAAVTTFQEQK
jgi:3-hydroxyisobutyrate dehydrogenase-like beta-hydroxyacid dehydrogenase/alkylhydroperoxidase/carboxymuconolactone decarboxylase family protein YurZ